MMPFCEAQAPTRHKRQAGTSAHYSKYGDSRQIFKKDSVIALFVSLVAASGQMNRVNHLPYTCAIYFGGGMGISTVFTNNRTQAVRLPADLRLPDNVKRVQVRALGQDRIISPLNNAWDTFFLNGAQVSDDFMSERASQEQEPREGF